MPHKQPFFIKGFNVVTLEGVEFHIEVSNEAFRRGLARWSDVERVIEPWTDPELAK